jgi:hypothetical protein
MGRGRWRIDVRSTARAAGLDVAHAVFVLGVTDRRLVSWDVTRLMAAPTDVTGSLEVSDVATITAVGRFGARRVAVVFGTGHVLVVRPEQGFSLRGLVDAFVDSRH